MNLKFSFFLSASIIPGLFYARFFFSSFEFSLFRWVINSPFGHFYFFYFWNFWIWKIQKIRSVFVGRPLSHVENIKVGFIRIKEILKSGGNVTVDNRIRGKDSDAILIPFSSVTLLFNLFKKVLSLIKKKKKEKRCQVLVIGIKPWIIIWHYKRLFNFPRNRIPETTIG